MTTRPLQAQATRFAKTVLAQSAFRDAATILSSKGIAVMPLKGVLLQRLVYDDPIGRDLSDVDVAVRSVDYREAVKVLSAAGYAIVAEEPGLYEVALRSPTSPLCIDLHHSLVSSRRFRLTPDVMFERGRHDEALFGFPVVLPDDYDLYSHLLAHGTIDCVMSGHWPRASDLQRLVEGRCLTPRECAARLELNGMARLARVGLTLHPDRAHDAFSQSVLVHLPWDTVGEVLTRVVRSAPPLEASLVFRRVIGLLLNPTLVEAALAIVEGMGRRLGLGESRVK